MHDYVQCTVAGKYGCQFAMTETIRDQLVLAASTWEDSDQLVGLEPPGILGLAVELHVMKENKISKGTTTQYTLQRHESPKKHSQFQCRIELFRQQ